MVNSQHSCCPSEHHDSKHNAIHCERRETAFPDIAHEPGDGSVGDDQGDDEADGEDDPLVRCDLRDADGIFIFAAVDRFEEGVERGYGHGWYRQEEGELKRGGARHPRQLSGGNG